MEMSSVSSLVFFVIMAAAKAGCRSSCTRSKSQADKGEITRPELPARSNLNFVSQTYTALSGVPRSNSFGKQLLRVVSSIVFGEVGEVRIFPFFSTIRYLLHVDLFLVGVQFSGSKGDEVTLSNELGFTEFHVHGYFMNFHRFPLRWFND